MAKTKEAKRPRARRDGKAVERDMTLVLITGHSGAGKSEAIAAF
jgi:serine kinase of HPr protein (carbohydrate metabolism regulator)